MREQEFYEVTEQHWKKEREKRKRCKLRNEWAWSGEWGHKFLFRVLAMMNLSSSYSKVRKGTG